MSLSMTETNGLSLSGTLIVILYSLSSFLAGLAAEEETRLFDCLGFVNESLGLE